MRLLHIQSVLVAFSSGKGLGSPGCGIFTRRAVQEELSAVVGNGGKILQVSEGAEESLSYPSQIPPSFLHQPNNQALAYSL